MPSIVYPRPNRKVEILSAARPAWQLICPLWLFSILFTKGKHIFKTPFYLIKNTWKFGDTKYSQGTWLIHSIYLVITESESICAQPRRATWLSTLCLLLCYVKICGSQASCAHCQILPHTAYPSGTSRDVPSPQSFPGCLRNRTWSPSTSSLWRGTVIPLNHSCLLVSKPVYPRLSALKGWAGVKVPSVPAKCPEWPPPSKIPAEWKCCWSES